MNLQQYMRQLCECLGAVCVSDARGLAIDRQAGVELAVRHLLAARELQRKVMLAGNGGSAATASHLHNDLVKAVGVRALCLHEPALLTACANDEGYERCFEAVIERWADREDLLIAISCSGRSENILRAARAADERGCRVVTLTGCSPANPLRALGDLNFHVHTDHYGMIEVAHAALTHYLTDTALAALTNTAQARHDKDDSHGTHDAPSCDIIGRTLAIRAAGSGHGRGGIRRRRASA